MRNLRNQEYYKFYQTSWKKIINPVSAANEFANLYKPQKRIDALYFIV